VSLSRLDVVQGLLDMYEEPRYLEVGVHSGETLFGVRAAARVGVDPHFRFDVDEARRTQPQCELWPVESDEYFGRIASPATRFDVVFLDGLHTFEQTLRDLLNALALLADGGVVVVDDVQPSSSVAAIGHLERFVAVRTALEVESRDWMGDVYRLVFFVDSFLQQLSYRTVADTHGQMVVWRAPRESVSRRPLEEIARLTYEDLALERDSFRFAPYEEILSEIAATRG
jgi:hypothetical protein